MAKGTSNALRLEVMNILGEEQTDEMLEKAFSDFSINILKQEKTFFKKAYYNHDEKLIVPKRRGSLKTNGYVRSKTETGKKSFKLELYEPGDIEKRSKIIGVPNHFFGFTAGTLKPTVLKSNEEMLNDWFANLTKC